MRLRNVLGAAFLILGTLGVASVYGAYNDLDFDYRDDGMMLLDDEPWFPRGVIYCPCPEQLDTGSSEEVGTFLYRIADEGRGFCYDEFAADGGNFLIYPCFHLNEPDGYKPLNFNFEHYMPCDITDIYDVGDPTQCELDLDAAAAADIKILTASSLAYDWDNLAGHYPPYLLWGTVVDEGDERSTVSRNDYYDDVVAMIDASESEEAFLGWCNCWEPVLSRPVSYIHQVNDDISAKEAAASANHPVYLEVNEIALGADHFRDSNTACGLLGYNIRICPTPILWDRINPGWPEAGSLGWAGLWLNNRWASITGDAADMHFWSIDGGKPVICCVDAVWWGGDGGDHFPPLEQIRFMTYDAIIHRVNGVYWGMDHYVCPFTQDECPSDNYVDNVKPVLNEMGDSLAAGGIKELLTATFDDLMVEAIVTGGAGVVERTAIVGGSLAPKNHYCSGRYLIEACVKYREEDGPTGVTPYVYLIVACREGRASDPPRQPVNQYSVTFRPYFSGTWNAATVEVVNESRNLPVVNGTFTDTINNEGVHVYKFEKPSKLAES